MRYITAPIIGHQGPEIVALSLFGYKSRAQGNRSTDEIPRQLLKCANVIEVNLTSS